MKNKHTKAFFYFEGKNFMTPEILQFGFAGRVAYELSTGRGMQQQPIFGVTVCYRNTGETSQALSKLFQSESAARNYIGELREVA